MLSLLSIDAPGSVHNPNNEFEKLKKHINLTLKNKLAKREEEEKNRLSNVIELQKFVQNELFTEKKKVPEEKKFTEVAARPKPSNDNTVELFDTVSFKFLDDGDQPIKTVTIVSSQSDVDTGNINQHSAMGRALVGSEIEEEIEVDLPNGSKTIQIVEIRKHAS